MHTWVPALGRQDDHSQNEAHLSTELQGTRVSTRELQGSHGKTLPQKQRHAAAVKCQNGAASNNRAAFSDSSGHCSSNRKVSVWLVPLQPGRTIIESLPLGCWCFANSLGFSGLVETPSPVPSCTLEQCPCCVHVYLHRYFPFWRHQSYFLSSKDSIFNYGHIYRH